MGNVLRISDFKGAQKPMEKAKPSWQGLVLLHRKIRELPFYRTDSEAVHLWVHLIIEVNDAAALVATELGEYPVGRGQTITGRHTLARETGIEPDRIKYLLNKFEKMGMITRLANRKFTLITVTKYDDYQQFFVPTECQQSANANPHQERAAEEVVPTECQQSATKKLLTNNSLGKPNECATRDENPEAKNSKPAKGKLSCEEVWQCLKDELPEARGWRCLTDERRNLIRTFWAKANKISRNLDGKPMDMEGFRDYLRYIAQNCRWMLEDRPDQKSGKTWRRMKFDKFLTEKLYIEVREGDRDDR
ncbi:DNA replication protein [Atlantibacter subterranea]|uniref:DNA replication protein n=1 Tax=Atlantibacter subterraneus TaxID=255519 RepID=UPI0020C3E3AD|nr:DNA replication protein [Atlantibacter subterranea]UTJ46618.1 DNA replication protein [Atlantibacter subterranea]